jgi:hypothetical protein
MQDVFQREAESVDFRALGEAAGCIDLAKKPGKLLRS